MAATMFEILTIGTHCGTIFTFHPDVVHLAIRLTNAEITGKVFLNAFKLLDPVMFKAAKFSIDLFVKACAAAGV